MEMVNGRRPDARSLNATRLGEFLAVRSIYLPGDVLPIRIIQEGREADQGVGYLEDGTMVVVEGGKAYMDRTINVSVTKFINKDTGRMFFGPNGANCLSTRRFLRACPATLACTRQAWSSQIGICPITSRSAAM